MLVLGSWATPPKFHEKRPRERHKKSDMVAGEEKKARNFGPPFGAPNGVCSSMFFVFYLVFLFFERKRPKE